MGVNHVTLQNSNFFPPHVNQRAIIGYLHVVKGEGRGWRGRRAGEGDKNLNITIREEEVGKRCSFVLF